MPDPLVECIPNFSEARRPEVVEEIVRSIQAVAGVTVLDRHSDMDHNRTVVTLIGSPEAALEAAFQAIASAARLIDLDHHTGEHPRLGATDVVPFVPIRQMDMTACVELARRLGRRVGEELGIPVYLYEEAATRPERKNLEDVRRGEYEALKAEIGEVPERAPDFGPARLTPAGATIIGARQPLIAYNIYLNSDDVTIAKNIAKAVRNSSGGLRFVKALGLLVEGRAQVSMNLTNFRQTPIARVVEFVRREAARYGASIHHSELVGLLPQEALVDAGVWYTQLDGFEPQQILENRLTEAAGKPSAPEGTPVEWSFLDELAKGTSAPGGGAAAAYAGAMGAALVSMVARLTVGRKKYASVEQNMWQVAEKADGLRARLTQAVQDDLTAFSAYLNAVRMPKDSPDDQAFRAKALEQATYQTIHVPLTVSRMAVEVMHLALETAREGNVNAISNSASGFAMARAALTASGLNVRINCPNLADPDDAAPFLDELRSLDETALDLKSQLDQVIRQRGTLAD